MGRVGSAAVRALHRRGAAQRALVPVRSRAPWLRELGVPTAEGDYDDGRCLSAALDGVHTVILISRPLVDHVAVQERVVDACISAGITRIIKLSIAGAAPDAAADAARWHWRTEQHLQHAAIDGCVVRSVRTMQELLHQVPLLLAHQMFVGCQQDGLVADVDARDVGAVLAGLAVSDTLPAEPLLVTGPELLTQAQVTQQLARALDLPLQYVPCEPADLEQTMLAAGLRPWQVQDLVAFEQAARTGAHATITDVVQQWSGAAPRTFAAFAHELATSLRFAHAPGPVPVHQAEGVSS
jgi:uncharacterized protein YbjT (DUF2867 family)